MYSQGFTLVEIMVVVAIIGILASVAAPKMFNYILTAETTEAVDQAGRISRAIQAYADQNLAVSPGSISSLFTPGSKGNLDPTATDVNTQITSLIPNLTLPSNFAYKFLIYASVDTTTRTASVCIKAIKITDNQRFILYSNQISPVAGWEGNVYRKIYLDKTGTPVAGGACTTATGWVGVT
ncbi:MAG: type II secretion system protein [Magnetococcales bacterium]|nr:type II secretion system protein [Magnetococcales bacterium]